MLRRSLESAPPQWGQVGLTDSGVGFRYGGQHRIRHRAGRDRLRRQLRDLDRAAGQARWSFATLGGLLDGWLNQADLTGSRPRGLLSGVAFLLLREPRLHRQAEPTKLREHISITFRVMTRNAPVRRGVSELRARPRASGLAAARRADKVAWLSPCEILLSTSANFSFTTENRNVEFGGRADDECVPTSRGCGLPGTAARMERTLAALQRRTATAARALRDRPVSVGGCVGLGQLWPEPPNDELAR